jgi:hypothetical protein
MDQTKRESCSAVAQPQTPRAAGIDGQRFPSGHRDSREPDRRSISQWIVFDA